MKKYQFLMIKLSNNIYKSNFLKPIYQHYTDLVFQNKTHQV